MSKKVTIKVPGKLFIAGEYAVTRPGGLALVAAIETDFSVTVSESSRISCLHTNVAIEDYEFSLGNFIVDMKSPWNYVLMTLKQMPFITNKEIKIDIHSDLGFKENKKGYGSSASVVSGVAQAIYKFFDLSITWFNLFERAALAHYLVQGSGSMGDVAAIMFGGVNYYSSVKMSLSKNEILSYKINPIEVPWDMYVVQTHQSIKTKDKLTIDLPDTFYDKSDTIINKIYDHYLELQDKKQLPKFLDFKRLLLQNQQLLIDNLPEGYVTAKLALALNLINACPHLVGKISGSGFGENMIVFANGVLSAKMTELCTTLEQYDMKMEKIEVVKPID